MASLTDDGHELLRAMEQGHVLDVLESGLRIDLDGNMWRVCDLDFVNLQESDAGFGETVVEAIIDFAARRAVGRS